MSPSRLVRHTDIATAQSFTGHSDEEMVNYYSHASPASRRAAMEAMYGNGNREKLREVFDKVRSRKLDFEEFLAALK